MKKKILAVLIMVFALCLSIFTLTACAKNEPSQPSEPPHTHISTSNNDGTKTIDCTCGLNEVVADENVLTVNDGVLTAVTDYGRTLSKIVIPSGVTNIGGSAFEGFSALTSVTIPNTVEYISARAFYGCTSLVSVSIPDSVIVIGNVAFAYCNNLTTVTVGNGVTSIGEFAFNSCEKLTSVTLGNSVTSIGNSAFKTCSALSDIVFSNSLKSIGNSAFEECVSLITVTLPDSVRTIGEKSFYACIGLKNLTLSKNLKSIGDFALAGLELTHLVIPASVTNMGYFVFAYYYFTIYCEAESMPTTWNATWNPHNYPVVWGYTG